MFREFQISVGPAEELGEQHRRCFPIRAQGNTLGKGWEIDCNPEGVATETLVIDAKTARLENTFSVPLASARLTPRVLPLGSNWKTPSVFECAKLFRPAPLQPELDALPSSGVWQMASTYPTVKQRWMQ